MLSPKLSWRTYTCTRIRVHFLVLALMKIYSTTSLFLNIAHAVSLQIFSCEPCLLANPIGTTLKYLLNGLTALGPCCQEVFKPLNYVKQFQYERDKNTPLRLWITISLTIIVSAKMHSDLINFVRTYSWTESVKVSICKFSVRWTFHEFVYQSLKANVCNVCTRWNLFLSTKICWYMYMYSVCSLNLHILIHEFSIALPHICASKHRHVHPHVHNI